VPWAATESDDAAKVAAGLLQRDLAAARDALQLRYPTFALVCDLEAARGFAEFRRSLPPETLKKGRIGQRLPLVPNLPPAVVQGLIDGQSSVSWTGAALAEDAWYRRWTSVGYVGLAAVLVVGVGLAIVKMQKSEVRSQRSEVRTVPPSDL